MSRVWFSTNMEEHPMLAKHAGDNAFFTFTLKTIIRFAESKDHIIGIPEFRDFMNACTKGNEGAEETLGIVIDEFIANGMLYAVEGDKEGFQLYSSKGLFLYDDEYDASMNA